MGDPTDDRPTELREEDIGPEHALDEAAVDTDAARALEEQAEQRRRAAHARQAELR